jgi:hypothetical protein
MMVSFSVTGYELYTYEAHVTRAPGTQRFKLEYLDIMLRFHQTLLSVLSGAPT